MCWPPAKVPHCARTASRSAAYVSTAVFGLVLSGKVDSQNFRMRWLACFTIASLGIYAVACVLAGNRDLSARVDLLKERFKTREGQKWVPLIDAIPASDPVANHNRALGFSLIIAILASASIAALCL